MNENELDNIFGDDCPKCEFYRIYSIVCIFVLFFILLFHFIMLCCDIYSHVDDIKLNNNLEILCNQHYDTNSCSVVYKNDDVVLFDTYNGYVTMENILK